MRSPIEPNPRYSGRRGVHEGARPPQWPLMKDPYYPSLDPGSVGHSGIFFFFHDGEEITGAGVLWRLFHKHDPISSMSARALLYLICRNERNKEW